MILEMPQWIYRIPRDCLRAAFPKPACLLQVTGGRNGYGAKLTNIFSKKPMTYLLQKGTLRMPIIMILASRDLGDSYYFQKGMLG